MRIGWSARDHPPADLQGGQTIGLRFRFDSMGEFFNDHVGWMIDDVEVSSCNQDPIFADGFESGDLGSWTVTVGSPGPSRSQHRR